MRLPGMPVRTLRRRITKDGSPFLAAIGAGFAQPVSRPLSKLARDDARFRKGLACGTMTRTGSRFGHG
jgi:hypothetical protein